MTNDILDNLSPEEVRDLTQRLVARERNRARADAFVIGDLLASTLRVAGEPELARQVRVILDTLRQDFVNKAVR